MRAPSIVTGFVLLVTLAFSVDLASAGQDRREQPDEASTAEEPAGDSVGHKEVPVDPPAVPVNRSSQARSPRAIAVRGSYQSFQVNVDGAQNNIVGDAANEPTIAVDPTNPDIMVIGWRQFDTIASNFRQAGVAYSHDGGATWTFPGPLDPGQFRSDPVLAADSLGNFYYYSLSSVTTAEYFVSTDKGVSWSNPISSPGGDKNWHTIDVSGGGGDGHIHALWNSQFTCCAPGTDYTRSTDGTVSFEGPYILPQHPKWGTDDVGPDGELYIVGATLGQAGHLILRSDDADDALATPSFALATSIDLGGTTSGSGTPNPGGLLGQVWVAVDRSNEPSRGNVYVLASVDPPGADPLDVHFISSEDQGQTWSAPLRVNDDPTTSESYQWFGTMSVAPDGRIDVIWNDTRNGGPTQSELHYAYSTDAGATFSQNQAVSPSFDSTVGHPAQNKIGDYYHMVSDAGGAGLAYSATFNGEQDVYYLRVGDCNTNGVHDSVDLSLMTSTDANANDIPDECEPDCNGNDVPDGIDISDETSDDCNANDIPDECDMAAGTGRDCNGDGLMDSCDVAFDLESSQGFVVGDVGDTATSGVWVQTDPIGSAAQPEDDHTPGSGTTCFVTGATTDVGGGTTTLFSPGLDLTGAVDPWVGYWRWYSNNTGGPPGLDRFTIDVSNDGGLNWTNVETIGPTGEGTGGGWFFHIFRVSDLMNPTNDVMLRFVAIDLLAETVVEAAIDDLVVIDCASCGVSPPGEVDNLKLVASGQTVNLTWSAEALAASYGIYRGTLKDASDLECLLSGLQGTGVEDDGLLPAAGEAQYYVTTAANCAGESTLGPDRVAATVCP
jgi:hypothetical protein